MADEDRELFQHAIGNDPPQEPEPQAPQTEEAATPGPKEDATGRLHGEGGKFVAKTKDQPVEQQAEPAPAAPQADGKTQAEPKEGSIPPWRLSEVTQERNQLRDQLATMRAQMDQLQRQQKPPDPPKTPDIFEDPQGYTASIEQRFDQRVRQLEQNFSFRLAHGKHGQDFETAYQALVREGEIGNRQTVQAILASPDPGEAMMRWHRQSSLYEKTGGDLDKFLQSHTDKLLQDEAFLTKAAEAIRARANGSQPNGQRPASIVQLPPSLNKVPAAASAVDGDNDMSDGGLFRHAMR